MSPKIKAIAHRLDGRYTSFNDDDLYQEAVYNLWSRLNFFQDKTDSYILQNCYFLMKNYIRTRHKALDRRSLSLDAPINPDAPSLADAITLDDPRKSRSFSGYADFLTTIMALLGERERQVLVYLCEGLTTRQIGEKLGISHVMVTKITAKIRGKCCHLEV